MIQIIHLEEDLKPKTQNHQCNVQTLIALAKDHREEFIWGIENIIKPAVPQIANICLLNPKDCLPSTIIVKMFGSPKWSLASDLLNNNHKFKGACLLLLAALNISGNNAIHESIHDLDKITSYSDDKSLLILNALLTREKIEVKIKTNINLNYVLALKKDHPNKINWVVITKRGEIIQNNTNT